MKTKIFILLLTLVASVGTMFASDTSVNGIWYNFMSSTLTAEVTYRGNNSNSYTSEYKGEVIIPSSVTYSGKTYSVTSIGEYAFYGCSLTSISIPSTVTSIGSFAFHCSGLTSPVYNAHVFAFMPTTYSGAYTIPDGIESIAGAAFYECHNLTSVTISNSVTSIGDLAFCECSQLASVTIPNSVTNIGESAFSDCSALTSIYCESAAPASISDNTFKNVSPSVYVPQCAYTTYHNAPIWKDMTLVPVQINMQVVNNVGGLVAETCGSMEVEAIPFEGYHFKKWHDGNKDNPRKYKLSQSNLNFIAQFEINKYTITLNCDANQGSITGDKGQYNYDTDHTIEAVPNYGYHFTQWSDGETDNPREFTLVQDTTFTALFAPNKYKLTIQYDNTYGSVEGDQGSFDYLSEHEIQFNAKYGYHFTEWSDGVTDNPRTLILTKDTTITASFAPNKYQLELIADANMGAIEGEQGSFDYLSEHEITAVSNAGYLFSGWSDGAIENPRTITLTRDTSITALFEHNLHTVTLLCDENQGSIAQTGDTHHLSSCTITATPKYGYHFTQWTDGDTNNPRTFIVTQDTTFTAEFAVDKNGTCGDELALTWTYDDESKELTIRGEGTLNSNYIFGVEATPTTIEKLVIEDGVTTIGNSAFANYTAIKELHLASSVKALYEQAFYNCIGLEKIYSLRNVPSIAYSNTFDGDDKFGCTLYVPEAAVEMYKLATGWRDFYHIEAIPAPPTPDNKYTISYVDNESGLIDSEIVQLHFPKVPEIEGFTFLGWKPMADMIDDNIIIQAIYEADSPTSTPAEVSVSGSTTQKLIRNGNVYILTGDKVYTVTGQEVK